MARSTPPRQRRGRARTRALVAALLALCPSASAGEVMVAAGPTGVVTNWRSDYGVGPSLRFGYRIARVVAIDSVLQSSYATVDQRMLSYVSLGATLYGRFGIVRPHARLAAVHQHEEPLVAIKADPGSVLLGVGDGIRHRAGATLSLGADVVVYAKERVEWFLGGAASGTYFPDTRGPQGLVAVGGYLGLSYAL